MTESLILAGGFGTRLRSRISDQPKVLAPVKGKPFLAHQLGWLADQGISGVILAVHHMADQVITFAREHNSAPLPIRIVHETEPLGTGGAIKNAFMELNLDDDTLVINGDTLFSFSLPPLIVDHIESGAMATIAVAQVEDVGRFGTVLLNGNTVTGFRQATGEAKPGYVNAGAYMLSPAIMADAPEAPFSIERNFFPLLADEGRLRAHRIEANTAFWDIGTPDSYDSLNEGRVGITLEKPPK